MATEHDEVLKILEQFEVEEKVKEAQARGRARIKEVIQLYIECEKAIPKLQQTITSMNTDIESLGVKYSNELTQHRRRLERTRELNTIEIDKLETITKETRLKISELEKNLAEVEATTSTRINECHKLITEWERKLSEAEKTYKKFKEKHLV